MKHIIEVVFLLFSMVSKYFVVLLVLLFDGVIFGYPLLFVNNNVLTKIYSVPHITYFDAICILFVIKLLALMVKSVSVGDNINNVE